MEKTEEFENQENMELPVNPDSETDLDKKTKKAVQKPPRKKLHLKATLYVAAVLLVVMSVTVFLYARHLKNKMISDVDEKLNVRSSKIITYNNWINTMQRAEHLKTVYGENYDQLPDLDTENIPEDSDTDDEEVVTDEWNIDTRAFFTIPEYSFYAENQDHTDAAVYRMQELFTDAEDGATIVATAIITDPDGDSFFVLDNRPYIEYGGLIYREDIGFDSRAMDYTVNFVGLNTASKANSELLEAGEEISSKIEEQRRKGDINDNSKVYGWYNDYRYIAFEDTVYYDMIQFERSDEEVYSSEVGGVIVTTSGANSIINDNGNLTIYSEDMSGLGVSGTLQIMSETVIFVDMNEELSAWKNQVVKMSVIAAVIYILIVVGCAIFEQKRTPEAVPASEEKQYMPEDQIPSKVASILIRRINDIEQSMGPNGYLDQLRDEIDSRQAPEPEEKRDDGE